MTRLFVTWLADVRRDSLICDVTHRRATQSLQYILSYIVCHDSWMCDMTRGCMWHDSVMCDMTHRCAMTCTTMPHTTHSPIPSLIHIVAWLVDVCHVTQWCVTWLMDLKYTLIPCLFTHSPVHFARKHIIGAWRDSMMCNMTRRCVPWLRKVWHDSCIRDSISMHTLQCDLSVVWHDSLMCDMTNRCATWLIDVWHDSLMCE